MNNDLSIASVEEKWNEIKAKIEKLQDMIDGEVKMGRWGMIPPQENNHIYTSCFDLCNQRRSLNRSGELYHLHGETIRNYLTWNVLPVLREKIGQDGTILLTELQFRWTNHQIMNKRLKSFFAYLDRYYLRHGPMLPPMPTLLQVGLLCFRIHIYDAVKQETTTAILGLINDEREGKIIDKTLIKSIVKLYVSIGMGSLNAYNTDLEEALLTSTREYYSKKRKDWINDSTVDYSAKAQGALREERNRVADYLNASSEEKILKVVEKVLLEKESSGCRLFLQNGKSDEATLPTAGDKRKHQEAELEKELRHCAWEGVLDRMRNLVLDQQVSVNCTDKDGQTPLIYAVARENTDAAQFLMENGAAVDAVDSHGNTALTFAIVRDRPALVQILLEHGASSPRHIGTLFPPLAWAIRRGSEPIWTLLLQIAGDGRGVDVNAFTPRIGNHPAKSPLCEACKRNNLELARFLIQNGARVVYHGVFPDSPCPLWHAVHHGSLELVRFLVDNGADVNERPFLCEMAKEGWSETARFLLQAGANVDQRAANDNGKTPLWIAAENGNVTLVKELLVAGADPSICDNGGDAPLVGAHSREHMEVEYLLIRQSPLDWLRILLGGSSA